MKKIISIIAVAFITLFSLASCCGSKKLARTKEPAIAVDSAFKKVYEATQQALLETKSSEWKLDAIDLTFATTTTTEIGGGVTLGVVSGEYNQAKSSSKTVTYTFGESGNTTKALVEDKSITVFKNYLISVINAAKGIKNINNFGLTEMEVEVEFTITRTIGGGIEIELSPITPTGKVSREKETVHTITLTFKK